MILITGAEGLIGRHLAARLEIDGLQVRRFDKRRSPSEDVTDPAALSSALKGVSGVVHLAAMSRIVPAQREPVGCYATNVVGLRHLLRLCAAQTLKPWVVFASSREVYGERQQLPVSEDAELRPMNVYARTKLKGEQLMLLASRSGVRANVVRLSNVYGCHNDHKDRVMMAFAKAAASGGTMRLEGPDNTFDFTSVHDVADGLQSLVTATIGGERLPPVHLVSGKATSLRQLALTAQRHTAFDVQIVEAEPRSFDVSHFVGDPAQAAKLLGWRATTSVSEGMKRLIGDLRA